MKFNSLVSSSILAMTTLASTTHGLKPLTPLSMLSLPRPSTAVVNPAKTLAVFSASRYVSEVNKSHANIHQLNLANNTVSDFTAKVADAKYSNPVWLDDSSIAYLSEEQLHVKTIGQDSYQLSNFPVGISNVKFNHASKLLVFSAPVYADGSLDGAKKKDDETKDSKKDTALAFDSLMVRHWDDWIQEKKNNIFTIKVKTVDGKFELEGEPTNLLLNSGLECPMVPFGDQGDFDVSPDGSEVVFVSKITTPDNAWQTTTHIYTVPTVGGELTNLNPDAVGAASGPVYSATGKSIAYFQMHRPQYEADQNKIVVYTNGESKIVAKHWDRSPSSILFDSKDKNIFVTAEDSGSVKIFSINLETDSVSTIVDKNSQSGLTLLDDDTLLYSTASIARPADIYSIKLSAKEITRRTDIHKADLADVHMSTPESVWFKGDKDKDIHAWLLKPIGFDETKTYPLAFIVHGGPQSAFNDNWNTRWNPNVFASAGFVVMLTNPTGSTGYGQELTDAINNNWGGSPYIDLMNGLSHVLDTHSYIDRTRVAALGASYGGYMMNWIQGHNDFKFNCLVNHDGIFDTKNGYYTTEELYFPEHEYKGVPWDEEAKKNYERWNPAAHVANWQTPMLVIHSDKDYRLPVTEGLATFTVLQRKGIPSRFLYFPDENHWVLKPANSERWHAEVLGWIQKWTAPKKNLELESQVDQINLN